MDNFEIIAVVHPIIFSCQRFFVENQHLPFANHLLKPIFMENDPNLYDESFTGEPNSVASSGGNTWLPIAVGVAGIFIGATALYLSINSSSQAQSTFQDITANQQAIASLKEDINSLQTALQSVEKQNLSHEKQMRSLTDQAQTAINQLGKEVTSTQRQVSANYENLGELATALKQLQLPPAQQKTAAALPTAQSTAASNPERSTSAAGVPAGEVTKPATHTIQAGDTFEALARMYGVPPNKIIEANPNTDPNRLQIGQVVNIP